MISVSFVPLIMSRRQFCLTALVLQTLVPFSSGAFFDNTADALRELEIPVARSLLTLKPLAKRRSNKVIGKAAILRQSSKTKR